MVKVRYKELPKSFEKIVAPNQPTKLRSSVGMEQSVGEFYYIALEKLRPYAKQARKVFDATEIEALASTIKQHGVSQPLAVKRQADDMFEIISGERRFRAAQLAGLRKVPCIILDDAKDAEEIALIENIQRADLHPLEISNALSGIIKGAQRGDQQALADRLGISKSQMSEYISYQTIPTHVREELINNNVRRRELLRKFVVAGDNVPAELLQMINLPQNSSGDLPEDFKTRSVVRIYFESGKIKVQKRGAKRLTSGEKALVREQLTRLLTELSA